MANEVEIRQAIKSLSMNPAKVAKVLDAGKAGRKGELAAAIGGDYPSEQVDGVLRGLLEVPVSEDGTLARPVEWIGAIATLAAGALAA